MSFITGISKLNDNRSRRRDDKRVLRTVLGNVREVIYRFH